MIKLGITGIIGSGKTTVSKIFEITGVPVFYADVEAKELYKLDQIKEKIKSAFGKDIMLQDGEINLPSLSEIVFSKRENLNRINSIIHPLVKEKLLQWIASHSDTPVVAYESALLFESNFNSLFDFVITVSCPEDICIQRVIKRNKLTREEVLSRMSMQFSNKEKSEKADFVINNDGSEFLISQVLSLKHQITSTKFQTNHK